MSAYLQTWTDGIVSARDHAGERLTHAASDQYRRMGIVPADVLYIAYLDHRRLHLAGRMPIDEMLTHEEAEDRFGSDIWEAAYHAVGAQGDVAIFDLRVPDGVVRALRFQRATGGTTELSVGGDGSVNGQALQSIRRLTAQSAALLDELLDDRSAPTGRRRRPVTPEENRAVELRAMRVVRDHYEAEGWSVVDVSASRPYDLVCRRAGVERHVEVKGLTGVPVRIALTANEVAHAQSCLNAALAVVSEVKLTRSTPLQADGGALALYDPWVLDDERLRATSYTYGL